MYQKCLWMILAFLLIGGTIPAKADENRETVAGTDYAQMATESPTDDLFGPIRAEAASVASEAGAPVINAKSAILMEVSTGNILFSQNPDEKLLPASITKIMSILLIVEALDSSKVGLDDVVTTSAHAAGMGGSQIWLEPGETMTVHELLKAVVIGSANDATTALAEFLAGTEETFLALMNQRAAELGMNDTHFMNCAGLDADQHYTTAHDVAVMSRELIGHDLIKEYAKIWMDSLRGGQTQLVNTNKVALVNRYEVKRSKTVIISLLKSFIKTMI